MAFTVLKNVSQDEKKAVEDARNFLAEGISPEIIAKCTGLPFEEVQKLADEIATKKA